MKTPTDLERLRDEAAAQRLKELTPYMSDKERQRLIDEGRSQTYTSVQIGFNTAVEIMSERVRELETEADDAWASLKKATDEITRLRAALERIETEDNGWAGFEAGKALSGGGEK